MDDALNSDSFSYPFKISIYLGNWPCDFDNPVKGKLFKLYRFIGSVYEWYVVVIGWIDLYHSQNNLKRAVYNLCVTAFTTTLSVKNIYFLRKARQIDKFRLRLHRCTVVLDDDGDVEILNRYRYILKMCRVIMYLCLWSLCPIWWVSSLMSLIWGPRELPFPVWLPLDLDDNYQYAFGFGFHALSAIIFVTRAIHSELAMFSLILQTTGLYKVLGKDLMKINEFYANNDSEVDSKGERKKDINKYLTRVRVKRELKDLLSRQLELKECVKEIEYFLHLPVFLELFGGLLLSVLNGFELIEATMDFSFKLSYQIAYTIIVLTDLFVCCLFSDHLMDESRKIYSLLYSLVWYEMDNDIRKDILLMIVAAQRVERLTVGKFFTLDLSTYLGVIKNLYSCLTVFRTVAQKNK